MAQVDQEKRQGRQALLAIDNEPLPVLVADDDRAEKVVAVASHGPALVHRLVVFLEDLDEIVDELGDLLGLPLVFALVVIDRVLPSEQELAHRACLAVDSLALGRLHEAPLLLQCRAEVGLVI